MKIDILSGSPDILKGPFDHSILKKASEKGVVNINVLSALDEVPAAKTDQSHPMTKYDEVIIVSNTGNVLTQAKANRLSSKSSILIVCDPKLLKAKEVDSITDHVSIGQYSISSAEFAAAVIVDSIVRLIPGAISDETSALFDSHQDGLLAPPIYTRPAEYKGWKVPSILLSGNEKAIEDWRMEQALVKTKKMRPDYLGPSDDK